MELVTEALLFLAAAVLIVPLSKRLGLGAILGYLAAGVLLGPHITGLVDQAEPVFDLAQIGVVLLLFLIGLELQPSRLWALRRALLGLGLVQVVACTGVLAAAGSLLGLTLQTALLAGFALTLSSTPLVLQLLAERQQLPTRHGRGAFAVLLFEDLAVIPVLALLPLLAVGAASADNGAPWHMLLGMLLIVALILGGRFLLNPVFRIAAGSRAPEVLAASALMVVLGTALLMDLSGLSMALGAFVAGVSLAGSEYRHQVESDIEPYKGLLLGLFFMAVGLGVNLALLAESPLLVLACVFGLITLKTAAATLALRAAGQDFRTALRMGLLLSQGGEFAFVLLASAAQGALIEPALADLLILVVALSMATTPILVPLLERVLARVDARPLHKFDAIADEDQGNPVIIAGFGRFGQIAGRVLRMRGIAFTALEISAEHVEVVRRYGNRIYYGDASRLDLLRAARADQARVMLVAVDDAEAALRITRLAKRNFPAINVLARARNRQHAHALRAAGAELIIRETFHSALLVSGQLLQLLGDTPEQAQRALDLFQSQDQQVLDQQYALRTDEAALVQSTRDAAAELERLFRDEQRL